MRDYLDSTRPLEPEREPTALPRLLEEAVELVEGVDATKSRRITWKAAPGLGEVVTDPGLLRQIVVNLLSNALDAVDATGASPSRRASAGTSDEQCVITVSDTGHGIPPDDLRRIFEPFYTTKGRGKGTGLGLAICRELTAALGGTHRGRERAGQGLDLLRAAPAPGRGRRRRAAHRAARRGGARGRHAT